MKKFKLNCIQSRFWMDSLLKYPSVEYNTTNYTFIVDNNLSIDKLKKAYTSIMLEYPPFSSIVEVDSDMPYFVSHEESFQVPFTVVEENIDCNVDKLISNIVHIPFKLQEEYPCRFYAIHVNNKYYLVHVFHHITIDGISFPMFFERLSTIYNALLTDTYQSIPQDESIHLFNNIYEQEYELHNAADLTYWKEYMEDYPLSLSIPRGDLNCEHSPALNFKIGEDVHEKVLMFKDQRYTSLFRLYATIWALTLAKATNTEKLLVDHTINMRPHNDQLLGVFVNNLPIRFDFTDSEESISDVFSSVNNNMLDERKHRYAFYHEIYHAMDHDKKNIPGGINVSISYKTGYGHMHLNLHGCNVIQYGHVDVEISNGLALLIEDDDCLSCSIRYSNQISSQFVNSLSIIFQTILQQVISNPEVKIKDLQLVPNHLCQSLIQTENERLHLAHFPQTFLGNFREIVTSNYNKVAVEFGPRRLTYGELDKRSDNVAAYLLNKGYNHRCIGISTPKNEQMIIALLGILKSGNIYVPIDYNLPIERIRFMISDCNLSLVLGSAETCKKLALEIESYSFKQVIEESVSISGKVDVSPTDDAYIIYTSGTTGKPKAIPIQHSMLNQMILNTVDYLGIKISHRVAQFANISFDASIYEIFPVLNVGGTLILPNESEGKDPVLYYNFLKENEITLTYIPPVFLSNLPKEVLPSLKTIVVAGDTTPLKTIQYWSHDYTLVNAYGPTESSVGATYAILHPDSMPNDIGLPESGVTCYVLDKNGHLLPNNTLGELYIGGVKLSKGYINRPELNKEKFVLNPFVSSEDAKSGRNLYIYKTGDLVIRRDDGHLLFMGRSDFQVKLNGFRIELGDIETQINNYGKGVRGVLVLLSESNNRKQLVAYIQVDDVENFSVEDLRSYLHEQLPIYMVPGIIIPLRDFPCNSSGKIDRKKLPSPSLFYGYERVIEPPITLTEKKLAEVWKSLLSNEQIGRDDDFISMGGDSIAVIQMSFSIQKLFGVVVRATDIYRCLTLRKISEFIDKDADIIAEAKDTHLSPNQLSLWLQCAQSTTIKDRYNLACAFQCPTDLNINKFNDVINKLIKVQDSFRMSFPQGRNRRPYMHISPFKKVSLEVHSLSSDQFLEQVTCDLNISFNLSEGPLYKFDLYHVDNKNYYCICIIHQMICDLNSLQLIKDIILRYLQGENIDWNLFLVQYSSYSKSCSLYKEPERVSFWNREIEEIYNMKFFPLTNDSDNEKVNFDFTLSSSLSSKILSCCKAHSLTVSEFLNFVYLLFCKKLIPKSDFILEFPVENREEEKYKSVIGNFMELLPFYYRKEYDNYTVLQYLLNLHSRMIEGVHNIIPFSDLLDKIALKCKNYQYWLLSPIIVSSKNFFFNSNCVIKKQINLLVQDFNTNGDELLCSVRYPKYFTEQHINSLLDSYIELINIILEDLNKEVKDCLQNSNEQINNFTNLIEKEIKTSVDNRTLNEYKPNEKVLPQTIAEMITLDIVSSTLNMPNVGIDDNLFQFGVRPQQVMDIVSQMTERGIEANISTFYSERSIKNIVRDKQSKLCYWGVPYSNNKSLLLMVCGYGYYNPYHKFLTDVFQEHYNLLIIESYHESFYYKDYTLDELLDSYMSPL